MAGSDDFRDLRRLYRRNPAGRIVGIDSEGCAMNDSGTAGSDGLGDCLKQRAGYLSLITM